MYELNTRRSVIERWKERPIATRPTLTAPCTGLRCLDDVAAYDHADRGREHDPGRHAKPGRRAGLDIGFNHGHSVTMRHRRVVMSSRYDGVRPRERHAVKKLVMLMLLVGIGVAVYKAMHMETHAEDH